MAFPARTKHARRALVALPFLALSTIMANAFAMGQTLPPVLDEILENSMFDWNGIRAPILRGFYGIKLLDDVFAHITVAFAHLQFSSNEPAYWHSLVFLTDFAGVYAILFFESMRPANRRTLFAFPFLMLLLAQLGGIGFLAPLYFYFFYIITTPDTLVSADFLLTDWASGAAVLPTVLLIYLAPLLPSYFHSSLEARNWWNWIWQLYPIWGSLCFFISSHTIRAFFKPNPTPSTPQLNPVRITVLVLALISTETWWYTMYFSPCPLSELFIPGYFSQTPSEAHVALRTILQYDHLCTFGAAFLWLGPHFRDLEAQGVCKIRYQRAFFLAAFVGAASGPGTLLLLAWLVREEMIASRVDDEE